MCIIWSTNRNFKFISYDTSSEVMILPIKGASLIEWQSCVDYQKKKKIGPQELQKNLVFLSVSMSHLSLKIHAIDNAIFSYLCICICINCVCALLALRLCIWWMGETNTSLIRSENAVGSLHNNFILFYYFDNFIIFLDFSKPLHNNVHLHNFIIFIDFIIFSIVQILQNLCYNNMQINHFIIFLLFRFSEQFSQIFN